MGDSRLVALWRRLRGERPRKAELDKAEMAEVIDRQTRGLLDMNSESFIVLLRSGELDRSDWRVEYLAGLVE